MTTQASPLTGKQVHYDDIKYFTTKADADAAIAKHKLKLRMYAQFVGAEDAWAIQGTYKSDPYTNPYVLRTDGVFRQIHTDKPATR